MFGASNSMAEGSSALAGLSEWIAHTLTGSVGTIVAVLAIAAVGVEMLRGRLAVRDGARVALGCFILFSAPIIARTLVALTMLPAIQPNEVYNAPPPTITAPMPSRTNRDPYAGASVPM